ncbi:hypothetical protein JJD41_07780 [Oxynema sp. CENA135]|uniref:hypothetical protein n=1 Tax=Oxynema sp. CENA135 TaxID=984206 RepID=UPI00190BDC98|nr:hypothetical protein [Oxynema sp. CENA135]MBK4729769.1 hypothetical protein [Oxynema sp. CENA135]
MTRLKAIGRAIGQQAEFAEKYEPNTTQLLGIGSERIDRRTGVRFLDCALEEARQTGLQFGLRRCNC